MNKNKTQNFLKREIGKLKGTDLNDDFYRAIWKEKGDIAQSLMYEFTCYMDVTFDTKDGSRLRKALDEKRQTANKIIARENPANEYNSPDSIVGLDDAVNIALLKLFLAPKYNPPVENLVSLQVHIMFIDFCYRYLLPSLGCYSWAAEIKLDHVLLKLTNCIYAMMHAMDLRITRIDQSKQGAEKKKKGGSEHKEAIAKILEDLKINHLKSLRSNEAKALSNDFHKKTKEATGLSPKRIMDVARIILKEKDKGLDTKPTV